MTEEMKQKPTKGEVKKLKATNKQTNKSLPVDLQTKYGGQEVAHHHEPGIDGCHMTRPVVGTWSCPNLSMYEVGGNWQCRY